MFVLRKFHSRCLAVTQAGILSLVLAAISFHFSALCVYADENRPPAVAGRFYPAEPDTLSHLINSFYDNVPESPESGRIVGIIAPHAGYVFSAQVAVSAYRGLTGKSFDAVILVGTNHYDQFNGASIYPGDGYKTPLGIVPVEKKLASLLAEDTPEIVLDKRGHGPQEHSLEVQLPFLQIALKKFQMVPVNIGTPDLHTCMMLARRIADVCAGRNVLLVASTDLSHYHSYDEAVRMDNELIRSIRAFDYMLVYQNIANRRWEACGLGAVTTVMLASQLMGANKIVQTGYATSGDIPGMDKSKVVGYLGAQLVISPGGIEGIPKEDRGSLLKIAHSSIVNAVEQKSSPPSPDNLSDFLRTPKGAFVTINMNGKLRGCIGYTFAFKPLFETVKDVSASAAVKDPRFPPMQEKELKDMEVSISVLSPLRRIFDTNTIKVGTHGIFIVRGREQGILLPQVAAEYNWDRAEFLKQACRKAGLPPNAWKDKNTSIFIFSADIIHAE